MLSIKSSKEIIFGLTGLCFLSVLLIWLVIWPFMLTQSVKGKIGTTADGGQMEIHYVQPILDRHLWCYVGLWLHPDEEIILPDGSRFLTTGHSFMGRAYLDYLDLSQPKKKLNREVWDLSKSDKESK